MSDFNLFKFSMKKSKCFIELPEINILLIGVDKTIILTISWCIERF